jgi:hypothetical protein
VEKAQLIRTMQDAHERLAVTIAQIPDERLLDLAMDDWTGKDLLAHLAAWHDHSARVIDSLRSGRRPYDENDPANATDAVNARTHQAHRDDRPEVVRSEFAASFARLVVALERVTDEELFADDHWSWLGGEPLAEMILWDTSRHYEAHRGSLERLAGS